MFNITNNLKNICVLTHVFVSFGQKTTLHQSIWWYFLLFSISKKEYLTVQKKNFYKVEELGRESTCAKKCTCSFLGHMDNEGKGRSCRIRKICEYHSAWCKGCYQSDKQE